MSTTTSNLQPIKLWGNGGPNPPKVRILLEELSLPYEIQPIDFSQVKGPEYLKVNPNGRIPAIHDPNTNLTLWESNAILEYLVETYDTKEHKLSFERGSPEYYHAKQFSYFQASGQGPYYGQAVFFKKFHPEKVPSAIERYTKEMQRVTGVIEQRLKEQKKQFGTQEPWMVGNKLSYVDLALLQWQRMAPMILNAESKLVDLDEFTEVKAWTERMTAREKVAKVLRDLQQ